MPRTHYDADEFLGFSEPHTFEEQVDKKINLLYDMCILRRVKVQCTPKKKCRLAPDPNEELVRTLFLSCKSEIAMDNMVHGVIMGDYTLDTLLKRNGLK